MNNVNVVPLYELLYLTYKDDEQIDYILNDNTNKFYQFTSHKINNELGNIIVSLDNVKDLKKDKWGKLNDVPEIIKNIITTIIFNYLDKIIIFNKKKLMNIHNVIFKGDTKKIILVNNSRKHNNMEDIIIDLNYVQKQVDPVPAKLKPQPVAHNLKHLIPVGILLFGVIGYCLCRNKLK